MSELEDTITHHVLHFATFTSRSLCIYFSWLIERIYVFDVTSTVLIASLLLSLV